MTGAADAKPTLIIVTGMSGAGRSTALNALEDLGFFCVDNLPPQAFESALDACTRDRLGYVAFGLNVRVGSFLQEAASAIERTQERYRTTLLFLDASDSVLQTRFSSTRRPHPLRSLEAGGAGPLSVVDGITLERERLVGLRAAASITIDTTALSVHVLRRKVLELFRREVSGAGRSMVTRFVSFGFKYGPVTDCDMMFDVRFLDNPYFVPDLRPLSGLQAAVKDFVCRQEAAQIFSAQAREMLSFLIPKYEQEGKSYLTVGFGCTGGRHRSVAIAEWVASQVGPAVGQEIEVVHRDVERSNAKMPVTGDTHAKS